MTEPEPAARRRRRTLVAKSAAALRHPDVPVVAAAGLVLAVTGPYGTHEQMALPVRLAYWIPLTFGGWGCYALTERFLDRRLPPEMKPVRRVLLQAAVASVPIGLLVSGAGFLWDRTPVWAWRVYAEVLVITIVIAGVTELVDRVRASAAVARKGGGTRRPSFLRRLDRAVAEGELVALASEDHYLRVYTTSGSGLVLMRLADAVEELAGTGGLRVHRSYWVAGGAVEGIERRGGKPVLVLRTGLRVPVSRTYLRDVRAAGWLELPEPRETAQAARA